MDQPIADSTEKRALKPLAVVAAISLWGPINAIAIEQLGNYANCLFRA
jgi:hypothetical protein